MSKQDNLYQKQINLREARVLITGGTSGLGKSLAIALDKIGTKVAIIARNIENLDEMKNMFPNIITIQGDISNKNDIYKISGNVLGHLGGIDILVNNASYLGPTPLKLLIDTECEDLIQVLETNLIGPFRLTKAILPSMILQNKGLVINISSDAAVSSYETWGAYSISKAGLDHMSRVWNEELQNSGVNVISLDPGDMATPMHFEAIPNADLDDLFNPEHVAHDLLQFIKKFYTLSEFPTIHSHRMEDDTIKLKHSKFEISQVKFATKSRMKDPFAKLLVLNTKNQTTNVDLLQDISNYFDSGDIIVVNQSATIPSSFHGKIMRTNQDIEIRLAGWMGTDFTEGFDWKAITFGKGNWQEKTEDREEIQNLQIGDVVTFDNGLFLTIKQIFVKPAKFIRIQFQTDITSEELWRKIYEIGKPIQYSYLEDSLAIWDQQTIFSGPPLSLEPPSASFQFTWSIINKLRNKGVSIVPILHSAGLSSTGNKEVDSYLPLSEKYEIKKEAAEIIQKAKKEHKRIIALGTSVVRALESNALKNMGKIVPDNDYTDFVIKENYRPKIVTGIISGMHVPEESHMQILLAFANEEQIIDGYNLAIDKMFLWHEYGDITLIY